MAEGIKVKETLALISVTLLCMLASFGAANGQSWQWAKSAGGVSYDNATTIAADNMGNIYATGYYSSGSITFGTNTITNTDSGTADVFLVKYTSSGSVVWAKGAGGTGYDLVQSVATDVAGNVYITGYFQSPSIVFDTFTLTNTALATIFLAKYDTLGNVVWARASSGNYADYAYSVHADANGYVYITGKFGSSSVSFGGYTLNNIGAEDIFISKYDADGNVVWAKGAGGDGTDNATSITTDPAGNVYVCGWFDGINSQYGGDTLYNDSIGTTDLFLAKYDTAGNIIWVKTAGGLGDAQAISVAIGDSGIVYLAGNYSIDLSFGADTVTNTGIGSTSDIFLAKFDTSANLIWLKSAGGSGSDNVQSITVDIYNSVYVAGYFLSPTLVFGSYTLTNAGGNDVFFARYNSLGDVYGATRSGGANDDFGQSVATDTAGRVYIAGSFESPTIIFGATTLTNAGGSTGLTDMFIAKYYEPLLNVGKVNEIPQGLALYPNPNDGIMNVSIVPNTYSSVMIFDCFGREVYKKSGSFTEGSLSINLKGLTNGVYYASIVTGNCNQRIPFVME